VNWIATDHDYRLTEGTVILARVYRQGNLFRADVWPPGATPRTTTEATHLQAMAWAEEVLGY